MARLSTHVLDLLRGGAAAGVRIELHKLDGHTRVLIAQATTNLEGRTDAPLIAAERIESGLYELTFHAGDYYRRAGVALTSPPFLDEIVIRFGIADAAGTYHVPLLLSPYGYSTYRGT